MGKLPFPRLQILLPNGSWLLWIDDTEWCAPIGSNMRTLEYVGGPGSRIVEVSSQFESDSVGKRSPSLILEKLQAVMVLQLEKMTQEEIEQTLLLLLTRDCVSRVTRQNLLLRLTQMVTIAEPLGE